MKKLDINQIISQKNWNLLITTYSFHEICRVLSFEKAMHLVKNLFFSDIRNDDNQQYAVNLAFEIENFFRERWNADWKNDVFLGNLCSLVWRYDERYEYYKRAYDKLKDKPEALLLLLADCNSAPGQPPITDEESEYYLKKALDKKVTYEAATMMRALFRNKKDKQQEKYWDQMCEKLKNENVHTAMISPDVFKDDVMIEA